MEIKKEILKSPYFIFGAVIAVCIFGYAISSSIANQEEKEQPLDEIVIETIPYTDYDFSNLSHTVYQTYEDDKYTSMFGIDVAAHQGVIDWSEVKKQGVEFAYIRLGYRGAIEGKLNIDEQFERNYKGAIDNDIKVGIYWYSQPATVQEAIEEAQFVIDVLDDKHLDLPIAYDLEETMFYDGSVSRIHDMNKEQLTDVAVAFINEIQKNHHEVIIYTNSYWSDNYYDWSKLSSNPIWFAYYAKEPKYDRPFVMWQYTETGAVKGIDTAVDLDILFIRKNNQN